MKRKLFLTLKGIIQCNIPLKLIENICCELNEAYQKQDPIFAIRSSRKSMNLKELHGNSAAPVILFFSSLADVIVITKQLTIQKK